MATTRTTRKSSRLGKRNYKATPPLRFDNVAGAKKYIKTNRLRITENVSTRRGVRLNVVDEEGKARTISIEVTRGNGS